MAEDKTEFSPAGALSSGSKVNQVDHILRRQRDGVVDDPPQAKQQRTVLMYATWWDIVLIVVSSVAAVVAGALNPLLTVIYGQFAGTFDGFANGSISPASAMSSIDQFALYFVYLAIAQFVFTYITTVGFYYSGERIVRSLRRSYLDSVIRQNIAFFDNLGAGSVTTRLTSDMNLVQEGITGKLSLSLTAAATFGSAVVIAFVMYWKLALILCSTVVVLTLTGVAGGAYAVKYTKLSLAAYGSGATIAEEAVSSVRHVAAFGIQRQLADMYAAHLQRAEQYGLRARSAAAAVMSVMNAVPYLSYALSFWMGSRFLVGGDMTVAEITTTTLAIVIGAWSVGRVAPNTQAFIASIASASGILGAIARRSPQDPLADEGIRVDDLDGDVAFAQVDLVYPSRPDARVLQGLSFVARRRQTTAIVGASGSGKSSTADLLMRFYEPTDGRITINGHDIQSLHLGSLRQHISYVSQESTLFNTTILENISYGLGDAAQQLSAIEVEQKVVTAARAANAHGFISDLPLGYQTPVGEKGLQLSGGQRQRIAIARGLIGQRRLLLLDEATSALDTTAEKAVQTALQAAAQDCTTIVIAHRLSTILHADQIVVVSGGRVIEQGTHDGLMAQQGHYYDLVENQVFDEVAGDDEPLWHEKKPVERVSGSLDASHRISASDDGDDPPSGRADAANTDASTMNTADRALTFRATSWFIASINKPELGILLAGLALSALAGLGTPGQSIIFAKMIESLSQPPSAYAVLRAQVDFWSLMYLVLGLGALLVWAASGLALGYCEERLLSRAKFKTLSAILGQEIAFFDLPGRSTGALLALLSSSTTDLGGAGGVVLGTVFSFCTTIGGGIILSLAIGWKLALVCAATIPVVAGCGYVRLMMLSIFDQKIEQTQAASISYASEVVSNIRTVAALGLERHVLLTYDTMLAVHAAKSLRSILQTSVLYAASQSATFLCAALAFWYGGTLITGYEYSIFQFFICFASLISGSQTAGIIFAHAPGFSKAKVAAGELKRLLNRRPTIDVDQKTAPATSRTEKATLSVQPAAHIELRGVSFAYALRPNRLVLDQVHLSVQRGQFVALVGPSGCGKSTILALLERFYDCTQGVVAVNGQDVACLDLAAHRRGMALVGQEPTLFSGSIRDNLVLGCDAGVSDAAVEAACRDANIYEFIISLDQGFATQVGARGVMLSGGQRQRLAIARALLRNAQILLLDEATSSLDSESEKLVQQALDVASASRTTIAVAHRLSTIRHADLICVLAAGRIVERGTHGELMAARGMYFGMVEGQGAQAETA